MKRLLLLWTVEWCSDSAMEGWIINSWKKVLEITPAAETVDELPEPPAVYFFFNFEGHMPSTPSDCKKKHSSSST